MNDKLRAEKYSKMKEIVRKQEILISKKPINFSLRPMSLTQKTDAKNIYKKPEITTFIGNAP